MLQIYHNDDLLNFPAIMKYRMKITKECWEYDLKTNFVRFGPHCGPNLTTNANVVAATTFAFVICCLIKIYQYQYINIK